MLESGGGSCHYHDVSSAKLYVFGGGWYSGYTLSGSIQCVDLQQVLLSDGTNRIVGVNGVQIVGYLPLVTYGCSTLSQRVNGTDYLYLFDTFNNFIFRKGIDKLNMSTEAWESFAGYSGYRYGTFFKTENFIYSLGGGQDINRAPLSDPTSWQKVGVFSPLVHYTMALIHEKTVHLFGGSGDNDASNPTKNVYKIGFEDLDNLTLSWSKAEGELPFPISFTQAVITNKYAYILGGFRGGALSSVFWANTSDLTSWSVMTTSLPYGVYGPNIVVSGDSIICLSGFTNTGSVSDAIHLSFVPYNSSTLSCQEKLASDRFVCGNQSSCLYQDKCAIIEPTIGPTNITTNITTLIITCNGINQNDSSVCNGRGICNQTDTCICIMGYFGLNCNNFTCFEISHLNESVCNGFGKCTSNNTCECDGNHYGSNCSLPKCFNIESTNASVCTGRGICNNVNNCSCFDGHAGINCETVFNVISNISSNHVEIYQGENLVILLDTQPLIMENITFHIQSPYYNISSPFNLILNLSILTPGVYNFTIFASTASFKSFPSYFSVMIKNRPQNNIEIVERIENLGGNDLPLIIPRRTSHNIKTFITNVTFSTRNPIEKLGSFNNVECFIDYQYYFTVSNSVIGLSNGTVKSKVSTFNTTTITFTTPIVIDSTVSLNNSSKIISLSIIFMKGNYSILSESNFTIVDSPLFNNDYKEGTNRGVSIIDLFSFQSSEWIAPSQLLPLSYSYGFYHESLKKSIVISNEFSNTPNITIPLPYLSSKKLRIIQFVKDSLGNIYENEFIQVNVDPPTVSITDLLKSSKLTKLQRSVLPYDLSETNENDLIEKFNSIVLDPKNPESSLYSFQILTQSSLSERVSDLVVNKIESFLGDAFEIYQKDIEEFGFVKSKLSREGTQSTVSILSNILQDQSFYKVEESAQKLSKLILTGIIPSVISTTTDKIPIEEYSESRISISSTSLTVPPQFDESNSKFKNNGFNTSIIIKLSELTNSSVTTGLSSINYFSSEKTFNQSKILSSVVDFKFFLNGKYVILDNLQTPITIEFPVLNSSLLDVSKFNGSSKIKCSYWDEDAQIWSERGCRSVNWDSNLITCSCNHTTKFSTFIEFNTADILDAKKVEYLTATYIAEIVYGSVFGIISVIILISLFLLRKKQPASSRLLTPYLGMLALLIDSVLSAIIQKSILISFLQSTNSTLRWEEGPNVANIFGNVAMIISNTFILTAIMSYVLQVIRFQLLKIIYAKMNDNNDNQTRLFKILKVLCSTYCFSILIIVSLILNAMYWTLWVVLVRLNVIPSEVYTLIISISYTVIIFVYSVIISIVAICDFVNSLIKENSYNSFSAKRKSKLHESHQTLLNDNKRLSLWKKTIGKFVLQDGPLYFRTEMVLYLICFIFLIIQQAIGLLNEKYRHENESYLTFTNNDVIRIIFQILYQIVYILVFGGFACGTAIIYLIRKKNQSSTGISEMQTITQDAYGKILFETFCEKEFSTENLYLFELLQSNKNYTSGKDFDGMQSFLETIHDLFIKSNSVYEVNISSSCKKQFVEIYKLGSDFNNSAEEIIKLRSQISQTFEQLQEQIEMNLEDTFSRFVLTDIYEVFTKRKQTKIEIGKQMNVELVETQH